MSNPAPSSGVSPPPLSDGTLSNAIHQILRTSDLRVVTRKKVTAQLEENFGRSLRHRKDFIKATIGEFVKSARRKKGLRAPTKRPGLSSHSTIASTPVPRSQTQQVGALESDITLKTKPAPIPTLHAASSSSSLKQPPASNRAQSPPAKGAAGEAKMPDSSSRLQSKTASHGNRDTAARDSGTARAKRPRPSTMEVVGSSTSSRKSQKAARPSKNLMAPIIINWQRGSTRLPQYPKLGNASIDLYLLYKVVQQFGGYSKVSSQLWSGIYKHMIRRDRGGEGGGGVNYKEISQAEMIRGSMEIQRLYRTYILNYEQRHGVENAASVSSTGETTVNSLNMIVKAIRSESALQQQQQAEKGEEEGREKEEMGKDKGGRTTHRVSAAASLPAKISLDVFSQSISGLTPQHNEEIRTLLSNSLGNFERTLMQGIDRVHARLNSKLQSIKSRLSAVEGNVTTTHDNIKKSLSALQDDYQSRNDTIAQSMNLLWAQRFAGDVQGFTMRDFSTRSTSSISGGSSTGGGAGSGSNISKANTGTTNNVSGIRRQQYQQQQQQQQHQPSTRQSAFGGSQGRTSAVNPTSAHA
eukprot:jgi/Bigna1/73662/fgenesh1_pg.25_\